MEQLARAALAPLGSLQVTNIATQFDPAQSYAEQAQALVHGIPLSGADWQTAALLINLPGHSAIAACLLAELHGRMGHFPAIIRLRPIANSVSPAYELAEIINLQTTRERSRLRRAE